MKLFNRVLLPALVLLLACGVAAACSVPVFRFAFERWGLAPYRLTLVHDGPLNEADQAAFSAWMDKWEASPANVIVRALDKGKAENPADEAVVASLGEATLPALVLQYPQDRGGDKPFWTGAWERESIDGIADSPLRQEIARRLTAGQTAVWLVLECGDASKDKAASDMLTAELKRLESELTLPPIDPGDDAPGRPELRVEFSVLSVARDKGEAPLVAMLLNSESDLAERTDPLVFPVFGQGRALWPLVGAGITPENIKGNAGFLVGSCSCEVKEQNPGFDLLLTTDWKQILKEQGVDVAAIAKRELEQTAPSAPELVPIPSGAVDAQPVSVAHVAETVEPPPRSNYLLQWLIGISAVGLIVVALFLRRR